MRNADAVVVGGGVIGCAVAYFLAREGVRVTLLERDELGRRASGAAAGMLLPFGEAEDDGPFRHWGLKSLALFPELVRELLDRSGVNSEFAASGALQPAFDESSAARLRARAQREAEHDVEWLDAANARVAEPQLAEPLHGALWSPHEAHLRPPLLVRAYAAGAASLGARVEAGVSAIGLLRRGDRVVGVATEGGDRHAGCVVLCMGAWSPICASWLDAAWELPIEPVRGQILSLDAPQPPLSAIIVGPSAYLVPKADGSVVVGATEERVGFDCRVTAEGMAELLTAAPRLVPALARCTFRTAWAGLRPATPDRLPVIGPLPGIEGLLLATGHYRNGVLLSPITGRLVAEYVLGKETGDDARVFLPERWIAG